MPKPKRPKKAKPVFTDKRAKPVFTDMSTGEATVAALLEVNAHAARGTGAAVLRGMPLAPDRHRRPPRPLH